MAYIPTQISAAPAPVKLIRIGYVAALSLIAAIAVGVHFVADRVVGQSKHSATVINIAGKQRMLSQRSAFLLQKANQTRRPEDLASFKATLDEFQKSHHGLVHGSAALGLPNEYPKAVHEIYFNGETPLSPLVNQFVSILNRYHDRIRHGETISFSELQPVLFQAEGVLLRLLDNVVTEYEIDAKQTTQSLVRIQRLSISAVLLAMAAAAMMIFNPLVRRVQSHSDELEYIAHHDPLTRIHNRRAFRELGKRELENSKIEGRSMAVLLCDLDHFKAINDNHGHQAGDEVLKHFSNIVSSVLRKEDIFARVGGEEFGVILSRATQREAEVVARKICDDVRNSAVLSADDNKITATTSIGVVLSSPDNADEKLDTLMDTADRALYRAKNNGRDRYEFAVDEDAKPRNLSAISFPKTVAKESLAS